MKQLETYEKIESLSKEVDDKKKKDQMKMK